MSKGKGMIPLVLRASFLDPGNLQNHNQIGLEKCLDRLSGVATRVTESGRSQSCAQLIIHKGIQRFRSLRQS